jgi:elongation factor P
MKEAQDLRPGNTVKIGQDLFIIMKALYNKGARGASSVKMKMKNLSTGGMSETVYRASDKFEDVILEKKAMQFLYETNGFYTFMDSETFEQMDLNKDDLGDALNYLKEEMVLNIIVYGAKPVGVELPKEIETVITYTEPAVKGDTSGKILKAATIATGYEVQVPLYCVIGDKIRINTATDEFIARAN